MFSVIILYYKKFRCIEHYLVSIPNQTYPDYEIILVDGSSEDDIRKLINEKSLAIQSWETYFKKTV